ncbi:hypothetical protein HBB16_12510 [Pseudonocardia sp. MCCB 268]|nr:hypothetical protein [Pseudonocardia cytotoxica]
MECASFVAGPTGGMTLAQLGASGDPHLTRSAAAPTADMARRRARHQPVLLLASLSQGKRSITVDMRSDEAASSCSPSPPLRRGPRRARRQRRR